MALIADILLAAGALGAAFYCWVLGRRLRRFNNLENGMGGAVAVLSAQVDDLEKTLSTARASALASASELTELTQRAESVRRQLELQIASLHDVVPLSQNQRPEIEDTVSGETEALSGTAEFSNHSAPLFTRRRSA